MNNRNGMMNSQNFVNNNNNNNNMNNSAFINGNLNGSAILNAECDSSAAAANLVNNFFATIIDPDLENKQVDEFKK